MTIQKLEKTIVDDEIVLALLTQVEGSIPDSVDRIKGGEISQAFRYSQQGLEYILRVSSRSDEGFQKDVIAYDRFRSENLPIPRVLHMGEFEGYHYCITEVIEGETLESMSIEENIDLLDQLFKSMDAIYSIEPMGEGFGLWNSTDLTGKHKAHDYIIDDVVEWERWGELAATYDYFNLNYIKNLVSEMEDLRGVIPTRKYLVHSDFGFSNVLTDGEKITGVIDWAESIYGDCLYDIAWMYLWSSNIDYQGEYEKFSKKNGQVFENYNERIRLYMLVIGITSLQIFTESEREHDYLDTINCLKLRGIE